MMMMMMMMRMRMRMRMMMMMMMMLMMIMMMRMRVMLIQFRFVSFFKARLWLLQFACAVGVAMSTHFLIDSSLAKAEESDLKRLDRPACGGALVFFLYFGMWKVTVIQWFMVFYAGYMISRSTQLNHQPIDSQIGADEFWSGRYLDCNDLRRGGRLVMFNAKTIWFVGNLISQLLEKGTLLDLFVRVPFVNLTLCKMMVW